jgi:hypothetical protein
MVLEYMMGRASTHFYYLTVTGTVHGSFGDTVLLTPIEKYIGTREKIDGQKMLKIMNAYTLAFFNKHLKGMDSPLLDGPSPDFPEVILKTGKQ